MRLMRCAYNGKAHLEALKLEALKNNYGATTASRQQVPLAALAARYSTRLPADNFCFGPSSRVEGSFDCPTYHHRGRNQSINWSALGSAS